MVTIKPLSKNYKMVISTDGSIIYLREKTEVEFYEEVYVTLEKRNNNRWTIAYWDKGSGHYEGYKDGNVPDFPKEKAINMGKNWLKEKGVL